MSSVWECGVKDTKTMEAIIMKATEAVREIMEKSGMKFSVLMDRLGIGSNVLANRLNQDNISVKKLNEMVRMMDYKIVLVPRNSRVGADSYEIE